MAFQNHSNLFKRCVTSPFSYAINGYFYLTSPIQYPLKRIGCCHAKVIVAVCGYLYLFNTVHMFHEIFDLSTILFGQTIPCCIWNIDNDGPRFNDSLYDSCEIFIIGSASIFRVKLYIFYIAFGIFNGTSCCLYDFFTGRIKFVLNMAVAGANPSMYTLSLCIF